MKTKSTLLASLASLAMLMPAAHAGVLSFDESNICSADASGGGAAIACSNYAYLQQSYGDVAGVLDVVYDAPRYMDGRSLRWWDGDYNTLAGVAWADGGDGNSQARIDLKSLNGEAVTLTHFDLGAYANTTRGTTLMISDLSGNVLYNFSGAVGDAMTNMPTSFNGSWTGATGIRIEWMDSAFNVGIDNITYQMGGMAPVPEPETYAMFAAGLAVLGALARRRKR